MVRRDANISENLIIFISFFFFAFDKFALQQSRCLLYYYAISSCELSDCHNNVVCGFYYCSKLNRGHV